MSAPQFQTCPLSVSCWCIFHALLHFYTASSFSHGRFSSPSIFVWQEAGLATGRTSIQLVSFSAAKKLEEHLKNKKKTSSCISDPAVCSVAFNYDFAPSA